ncbi:MAG: HicB family protein [SAR202 cluster bacterium Io17-Chloro-G7]|nr:MAG: HicB family protein [SAR202 cluster bacterium Io17-Chloro-G7]
MKFVVTLEDGEDGFIIVSCPSLPGCHSQGESKEEAIANIKEAIEGYIFSIREQGETIPVQAVEEVEVAE